MDESKVEPSAIKKADVMAALTVSTMALSLVAWRAVSKENVMAYDSVDCLAVWMDGERGHS